MAIRENGNHSRYEVKQMDKRLSLYAGVAFLAVLLVGLIATRSHGGAEGGENPPASFGASQSSPNSTRDVLISATPGSAESNRQSSVSREHKSYDKQHHDDDEEDDD
jgi:hypothetical protein